MGIVEILQCCEIFVAEKSSQVTKFSQAAKFSQLALFCCVDHFLTTFCGFVPNCPHRIFTVSYIFVISLTLRSI